MNTEGRQLHSDTNGLVLHWAAQYDFLVWLVMGGKERGLRERLIQMAHLKSGERVLDVGCGTGTLAIAAKRRCGASSAVSGIDASNEMIARAKKKAVNAGVEIDLQVAICEALPFPTGTFDVVFSTMMLHHLGPKHAVNARVKYVAF